MLAVTEAIASVTIIHKNYSSSTGETSAVSRRSQQHMNPSVEGCLKRQLRCAGTCAAETAGQECGDRFKASGQAQNAPPLALTESRGSQGGDGSGLLQCQLYLHCHLYKIPYFPEPNCPEGLAL